MDKQNKNKIKGEYTKKLYSKYMTSIPKLIQKLGEEVEEEMSKNCKSKI